MELYKRTQVLLSWTGVCFLLLVASHLCQAQDVQSNIQRLRTMLLKNYDRYSRPVKNYNSTTSVSVGLKLIYIEKVDESKQMITINGWVQQRWEDQHLQWEPAEYGGLTVISVTNKEIWQPDISIYESPTPFDIDAEGRALNLVYSSGEALRVPALSVKIMCPFDLTDYPYDTQTCKVSFGCWTQHGYQVDIKLYENKNLDSDLNNKNLYWEVLSISAERKSLFYDCCKEPYPVARFKVVLKRRYPFQLRVACPPSAIAVLLVLAMFWLPLHSPMKFIFGLTSLLLATTVLLYLAVSANSPQEALLSVSCIKCMLYIVGAAILLETVVTNVAHLAGICRPPQFLANLTSGICGKVLCLRLSQGQVASGDRMEMAESNDTDAKHQQGETQSSDQHWHNIASALDRLLFLVFLVVIIVVVAQRR